MKNKIIKISIILIIFITTLVNLSIYSHAITIDNVIESGNDFINAGDDSTITFQEDDLQRLSKFVSNVLLTIALCVTLISGVVMGINFMVQSVEDKAKIKESMVPWIIGIFISFGAYGIWNITMNIFINL